MFIQYLFTNFPVYIWCVVAMIVTMTLSSAFQSFVAFKEGDISQKEQGFLTLNPAVHLNTVGLIVLLLMGFFYGNSSIDYSKLKNRYSEAIVASSGAFAALVILIVYVFAFSVMQVYSFNFLNDAVHKNIQEFLTLASYLSGIFVVFYLIPVPSFPGARIVQCFFPKTRDFFEKYSYLGIVFIVAIFLIPQLFVIFSVPISIFIAILNFGFKYLLHFI